MQGFWVIYCIKTFDFDCRYLENSVELILFHYLSKMKFRAFKVAHLCIIWFVLMVLCCLVCVLLQYSLFRDLRTILTFCAFLIFTNRFEWKCIGYSSVYLQKIDTSFEKYSRKTQYLLICCNCQEKMFNSRTLIFRMVIYLTASSVFDRTHCHLHEYLGSKHWMVTWNY